MSGRFVFLYTKYLESACFQDANLNKLWIYLLLRAKEEQRPPGEERKVLWGDGEIALEPGQLTVNIRDTAAACNIPKSTIHRLLGKLRKMGQIRDKSGTRFTLVTICNWNTYQPSWDTDGTKVGQKWDQDGTRVGHPKRNREREKRERTSSPAGKAGRGDGLPAGFKAFWEAYPRKVGKGAAVKAWTRACPDLDAVLAALDWQTQSEEWRKDGGQFIPHPATYLNQRRWEDEPPRGNGSGPAAARRLRQVETRRLTREDS